MKLLAALAAAVLLSTPASAADLNCRGPANVEDFRYTWQMRGGLSVIAGLLFPTSRRRPAKTTFPSGERSTRSTASF